MNPPSKNPNKQKHKARRKANERRIQTAKRNSDKKIANWLVEWRESRADYPVTKKQNKKKLQWSQIKKFFKQKHK